MTDPITRRRFHTTLAAGAFAGAGGAVMSADPPTDKPAEPARDYPAPQFTPSGKKPQLGTTLVRDFVVFAHYDLDMTKTLLAKEPKLAAATVDWGGGDWESGLGGASHMGRRDIAEYLLDHGARVDIFAAAMLGQLDVVKGLVTALPKLIDAPGPHGFSLHWHAKAGGKEAAKVYDYLKSVKPEPPTPGKKP